MNRIRLALARLFAKKKPRRDVEFPVITGQWSKPYESVTTTSSTDVIFIHASGKEGDE